MGKRLCQCRPRHLDPQDVGWDLLHHLRGQPDRRGLERGVADRLGAQRIEVGGEMAVHPVRLHERGRRLHVREHLLRRHRGRRRRSGGRHLQRRGGRLETEAPEDLLVEAVLAAQERLDPAEKRARLRALDHTVVVGRSHRHHLRDAELGEPGGSGLGHSRDACVLGLGKLFGHAVLAFGEARLLEPGERPAAVGVEVALLFGQRLVEGLIDERQCVAHRECCAFGTKHLGVASVDRHARTNRRLRQVYGRDVAAL